MEKHTRQVKVEPKVDQRAAEDAGKKTGESVAKGVSGSASAIGQVILGTLQGAGGEAGRQVGERLAAAIQPSMGRVGTALRNSLPSLGRSAGTMLGTAMGVAVADAIGKARLDKAGQAILTGLSKVVKGANVGTDIGVAIGNSVAGGLSRTSGLIGGAASKIGDTVGGIGSALASARELLGGDSWAAPGLDMLNAALGKASPLLESMNSAALLASTGAQAISVATGMASKAQMLWNVALKNNPIGLIVTAIAAAVTGLGWFFTKTELGRKIWEGFTEYLKVAWEAIKTATGAVVSWFSETAWPAIQSGIEGVKTVWQGLVTKAGEVWDGIKSKFTSMVDFVKGLPAAITSVASGMWDGLKNGLVDVLNWIGGKWNSFADALSFDIGDTHIGVPHMPTFGYSAGGFTGNIPIDKIAGVVHGGEFVVRKESTERIHNAFPGLLDYLNNNGALPGFKVGGLVTQSAEGLNPGADYLRTLIMKSWPQITRIGGRRAEDGYGEHSTGNAIDVMIPNYASAQGISLGNAVLAFMQKNASAFHVDGIIWRQKSYGYSGSLSTGSPMGNRGSDTQNHFDHLHIILGKGRGASAAPVGLPNGVGDAVMASVSSASSGAASSVSSDLGIGTTSSAASAAAPEAASSSSAAPASSSGGGINVPSSLTGWGSWAGQLGGDTIGKSISDAVTGGGKQELDPRLKSAVGELGDLGSAAGSFVDGQIGSALGVLGAGTSPGWLKGISTFVSGFSVGGKTGSVGGSPGAGAALSGQGASAAPLAAQTANIGAPATAALGTVHGTQGGGRPGSTFNTTIQARDAEGALEAWNRQKNEMIAAKLAHL